MQNLQFFHERADYPLQTEYTHALQQVEAKDILNYISKMLFGEVMEIELDYGRSKVHKNDTFCKKTGRDESAKRVVKTLFAVHSIFMADGIVTFRLSNRDVVLMLQAKQGRPHAFMMRAEVK